MKPIRLQPVGLSTKVVLKPKKKLKQLFMGSPIENITLSSFTLHGLPIPIYTQIPALVLLFKDRADCGSYLQKLYAIKADLEANDPLRLKPSIQGSILFTDQVIASLT